MQPLKRPHGATLLDSEIFVYHNETFLCCSAEEILIHNSIYYLHCELSIVFLINLQYTRISRTIGSVFIWNLNPLLSFPNKNTVFTRTNYCVGCGTVWDTANGKLKPNGLLLISAEFGDINRLVQNSTQKSCKDSGKNSCFLPYIREEEPSVDCGRKYLLG